jgi:hypothetical protein
MSERRKIRVTLNLTGAELVLLYIACGNEDARNIITDSIYQEKQFLKQVGCTPDAPRSVSRKRLVGESLD